MGRSGFGIALLIEHETRDGKVRGWNSSAGRTSDSGWEGRGLK